MNVREPPYLRAGNKLTLAAAADVQQTRLSAGAEAIVGLVIGPVGEQSLGGDVSIQRDAVHLSWTLVDELHGPEMK